jgi:hypothetical protein
VLQSGDHVGRYEIRAAIGEGGFGQVYKAWDPELERPVAIKELSGERQAGEPNKFADYKERFRLERRVQGQFQHPHIVSVYDLVQQDGNEYLVEEFVDGGTLRARLDQEPRLPPERVVQLGLELCQAITAIWEADIVHRDIKPSNILLTGEGRAKLTDFGVAQVGQLSQRTQADSRHPGTPAYMSPEQESGHGYLDERSDLYALGLVLYEALTGKSYKRERVPASQLAPDAPKRLEQAVMRALANDPTDRYQRAYEFEAALRQSLGMRGLPLRAARELGVIGSALLIVAVVGGWGVLFKPWNRAAPAPAATPTVTLAPSAMPTRPTRAPTALPSVTVTAAPSVTPTITATVTGRIATPVPVISAPRLASPLGASIVKVAQVTLQWQGELPGPGYGFRVSLRHESDAPVVSPIFDGKQWTVDLPGSAVGEWRWSVAVVRRDGAQEAAARSAEWTFYYNPFPSSFVSPLHSPLPVPTP